MRILKNILLDRYDNYNTVTIEYKGKTANLSCGTSDSIELYHDADYIYVYSENTRMPYAGLQVLEKRSMQTVYDHLLQTECDDLNWLLETTRTPSKIRFLLQWWQ